MTACIVTRWPTGAVTLDTPYDADYVAAIKAMIPATARRYDPATYTWIIKPPYVDTAFAILMRHFPEGYEIRDASPQGRKRSAEESRSAPGQWWAEVLFIRDDAPLEVAEAAYRALAKCYHPDLSACGDEANNAERMTSINSAIAAARAALRSGDRQVA